VASHFLEFQKTIGVFLGCPKELNGGVANMATKWTDFPWKGTLFQLFKAVLKGELSIMGWVCHFSNF